MKDTAIHCILQRFKLQSISEVLSEANHL